MTVSNYKGTYLLTRIVDVNFSEIEIPDGGPFKLTLDPKEDSADNSYKLSLKLGNRMAGSLSVSPAADDKDAVTISRLGSTRMMPPPPLYKVETALSDMLPQAEWIKFDNDSLVIEGPKGSLQCSRLN